MATNAALDYGVDIAGISDADELWSEVWGLPLVVQDAIHRITTDDVLGPGNTGKSWGFDVRKLVGAPTSELQKYGPMLSEVLTRDDRVETADVKLTDTTVGVGQKSMRVAVRLMTSQGAFQFTLAVADLQVNYVEGQS